MKGKPGPEFHLSLLHYYAYERCTKSTDIENTIFALGANNEMRKFKER